MDRRLLQHHPAAQRQRGLAAHHIRTSHDREETSLIGPAEDRCGIEPSPRFEGIDMDDLIRQGHIDTATEVIYEAESHAFGGADAMTCAHDLFHLDSRHLLAYLARQPDVKHRRELSILLCTTLLRSAGLDWYEQGDVWARVADHRELPDPLSRERRQALEVDLRRLISVDTQPLMRSRGLLTFAAQWSAAYETTGRELAALSAKGLLRRSLRAVLTHHIIFAWNRLGMPYASQAVLAHTAKDVVFGYDPTATESEDSRSRNHDPLAAAGRATLPPDRAAPPGVPAPQDTHRRATQPQR
nr:thiopeptide-type bacteriocin biosynthesis protein [Nonomuraea sp. K271]